MIWTFHCTMYQHFEMTLLKLAENKSDEKEGDEWANELREYPTWIALNDPGRQGSFLKRKPRCRIFISLFWVGNAFQQLARRKLLSFDFRLKFFVVYSSSSFYLTSWWKSLSPLEFDFGGRAEQAMLKCFWEKHGAFRTVTVVQKKIALPASLRSSSLRLVLPKRSGFVFASFNEAGALRIRLRRFV